MAAQKLKSSKNVKRNKTRKLNIVFNEEKRREFLSGFHKRKLQRKKKAQEELQQHLKEERKRLKTEARESYKKLVVSHRPIPELQNLFKEEYDEKDVTVTIQELSAVDIAKQNNWIGPNQPKYESEQESETEEDKLEPVPGMELKPKKGVVKKMEFATERDLKKQLKKQATKNVQKSKVFQLKNRMESQKQKTKSLKVKKLKIKEQNRKAKKKPSRKLR